MSNEPLKVDFPNPAYGINTLLSSTNALKLELDALYSQKLIKHVPHISNEVENSKLDSVQKSPLLGNSQLRSICGGDGYMPEDSFTYPLSYTILESSFNSLSFNHGPHEFFLRGGPRKHIYFKPEDTKVAIVTCGGLCPGLNTIIREITLSLHFNYNVKTIYGIKYGYKGFYSYPWVELTPKYVSEIHKKGGTI